MEEKPRGPKVVMSDDRGELLTPTQVAANQGNYQTAGYGAEVVA